jgi:adenylate cyclase
MSPGSDAYCICAASAFSETTEPEDVMSVLAEYHAAMGPLIHKYEGTLERFLGDGMMVLFNDPLPCPDAPQRAARMSVEMRDAVAALAPAWKRKGHVLGFGIGLAQGYATMGTIGCRDRFEYTAIGGVVNLAARPCADAADGQILTDSRLAAAIGDTAEIDELGERPLRGMSRSVAVVNLRALRS